MARLGQRDVAKERFWRRILRLWRQRRPRIAVCAFCAEQNVSAASFYAWRRTIADRDRQRRGTGTRPSSRPTPTAGGNPAAEQPLFVPLAVASSPAALACPAAALELVLAAGHVVRVPAGFDAATLRQLLAVLEEGPSC